MTLSTATVQKERSRILLPVLIAVLSLLPLFLTPVLPSIDFYAHIVRYNVLAHPEAYSAHYQPYWALLPNLGMDVLGTAVLSVLPPLAAAKLLAALVILAPVLGTMRLSHALHGQISPLTALMAGLLSYNLILFWGFANFLLGLGIALWSIGWWISERSRPRRQLLVMIPIGILILFIHGLVFGLWGLLLGVVELGLARTAGPLRLSDLAIRALRLLSLAVLPILLFLQMQTVKAEGGTTGSFGNLARIASEQGQSGLVRRLWEEILKRFDSILRVVETSDPTIDRLFGAVLWFLLGAALLRKDLQIDPRMRPAALLCFLLIWLMPPNLFDVGHLDERAPLLFLAILIASISVRRDNSLPVRALMVLFPIHLLMAGWGMIQAGQFYQGFLSSVDRAEIGDLVAADFNGDTDDRDGGRRCKPLPFLLQFEYGIGTPTFANPTQQPLRLAGTLATAAEHKIDNSRPLDVTVPELFSAGFDTVLVCALDHAPDIPGATKSVEGTGWAIYRPLGQ